MCPTRGAAPPGDRLILHGRRIVAPRDGGLDGLALWWDENTQSHGRGKGRFPGGGGFRRGFIVEAGLWRDQVDLLAAVFVGLLLGFGGERREESGEIPTQWCGRSRQDLLFEVVAGFEARGRAHKVEGEGIKDLFTNFGRGHSELILSNLIHVYLVRASVRWRRLGRALTGNQLAGDLLQRRAHVKLLKYILSLRWISC